MLNVADPAVLQAGRGGELALTQTALDPKRVDRSAESTLVGGEGSAR